MSHNDNVCDLMAENGALVKALEFYADERRYRGANQKPIPNDPYAKPDQVYIMDVSRDYGAIARAALAQVKS